MTFPTEIKEMSWAKSDEDRDLYGKADALGAKPTTLASYAATRAFVDTRERLAAENRRSQLAGQVEGKLLCFHEENTLTHIFGTSGMSWLLCGLPITRLLLSVRYFGSQTHSTPSLSGQTSPQPYSM